MVQDWMTMAKAAFQQGPILPAEPELAASVHAAAWAELESMELQRAVSDAVAAAMRPARLRAPAEF